MNKLHWYMRAVVGTALLVVIALGVSKGRNLLSAKANPSTENSAAETAAGAGDAIPAATASLSTAPQSTAAEANANPDPQSPAGETAAAKSTSWFSGWFGGGSKPKIVETPGREIGPATVKSDAAVASDTENKDAVVATQPPTVPSRSMLGKLKFGGASEQLSDQPAPPAAEPSPPAASTYTNDSYAAAPAEGSASSPAQPAFSGYENSNPAAPASDSAYAGTPGPTQPLPVASTPVNPATIPNRLRDVAPVSAPNANPPVDGYAVPEVNIPLATGAEAAPAEAYAAPVSSPAVENPPVPPARFAANPPVNSLSPPPESTTTPLQPVASMPVAPVSSTDRPAPIAVPNTLGSYAPVSEPLNSPAVGSPSSSALSSNSPVGNASASLGSSVPATRLAPAQRYANELPVAPATASLTVDPQLQGPQAPSIVLEKFAPPEVQVGRAAVFEILVKNVGKVPAFDVQVIDEVPRGTRYQEANPQPSQVQGTKMMWKIGSMQPGDEKVIEVRLVPETEGEIGSVAQVSFQAQVGSKSVVTRPKLELRHQAPQQVHAGENASVTLSISNSGSGAATGVRLESDVPAGFSHPAGPSLEYEVGTVRPGDTKTIELTLRAEKAGKYEVPLVIRNDVEVLAQDVARMEVVAPVLQLAVDGPTKRFVERQSVHTLTISNPGTAPAKNVEIAVQLSRGLKFISADHQGEYDARQHSVYWGLDELPPGSSGAVKLTTLPVEAGEQRLTLQGQAGGGLTAQGEFAIAVDAVSELPFTVADLADPIEVNSETVYEIRVANRGAREATNVRVQASFPEGVRPLEGDGVTQATVAGQKVEFEAISAIPPGSETVLRISAQGLRAGDHRIAVTVTSDEHPQPVTREEGTRVYLDR